MSKNEFLRFILRNFPHGQLDMSESGELFYKSRTSIHLCKKKKVLVYCIRSQNPRRKSP